LEGYANSGKDVQTVFRRASPFTPILNKCVAFLRGLQENERKGTGENNEKPYYSRLDPAFLSFPIYYSSSNSISSERNLSSTFFALARTEIGLLR
jgi:hypothetical protein